jgi:hypothetical protein
MEQSYREYLKSVLMNIVVGDYWSFAESDYSYHMNLIGRRAVRFPELYSTDAWFQIQELRKQKIKPTESLDARMVEMLEKLQSDFQL